MGGMEYMEPIAVPTMTKLFAAGSGAGIASRFIDAGFDNRVVTDEEILMSGLKSGLNTLVISRIASAYEYRSYVKWRKAAPSVKEVTERANNKIKSGTCGGRTNTSWYKQDGSINYPPNNGAVPGTEVNMTLKPGNRSDKRDTRNNTSRNCTMGWFRRRWDTV